MTGWMSRLSVEKLGVGASLLHSLGPGPAAVARACLGSEENDGA